MILGIETSCDDTSAAVLDWEGRVRSSVVSSQNLIHAPYGGIVPELASRHHLENLPAVVGEALASAGVGKTDLRAVAVTAGPGLLGSLLVGLSYAKAYAFGLGVPFAAVNHIEAHLASPWIEHPETPFPALVLVVSGGHSHLFLRRSPEETLLVSATRDDAAGEALDKVAKFLGLPYPGGPVIDRISDGGNPKAVPFPLPRLSAGGLDYSFSGIKTAALHHLRKNGLTGAAWEEGSPLPAWELDFAASYQKRVVDHLIQRARKAMLLHRPSAFGLAGGVACNRLLRSRSADLAEEFGVGCSIPSPRYCTDNAAMVAFRAMPGLRAGHSSPPDADAFANAIWPRC